MVRLRKFTPSHRKKKLSTDATALRENSREKSHMRSSCQWELAMISTYDPTVNPIYELQVKIAKI